MLINLSDQDTIANRYIAEMRASAVQQDRMRFRKNMERLGTLMGYEISKTLTYVETEVATPLGTAYINQPESRIVLGTILRAGLSLHHGMLALFDDADNAFVSAYRQHHRSGSFDIKVEYVSCPDLTDTVLIVSDPMLATGASAVKAIEALMEHGKPAAVHFATAIAAQPGVEYLQRRLPDVHLWAGAIDEELTAKSYIVPGLGDAGDLAYGTKLQS